jgi:hypothetical protein
MDRDINIRLLSKIHEGVSGFEKYAGRKPDYAILTPTVYSLLEKAGFLHIPSNETSGVRLIDLDQEEIAVRKLIDLPEKYKLSALEKALGIRSPLILCSKRIWFFREKFEEFAAYSLD